MNGRATSRVLGDFLDLEGRLNLWGSPAGIWVPPEVRVVATTYGDSLYYPMGVEWPNVLQESGDPTILLQKHRWRLQNDPSGLIEDVVALASDPSTSRVERFAKMWGPLWKCRSRGHGECLWSKHWMAHPSRNRCVWSNVEPVKFFTAEASRVSAVLQAFGNLREGKGVPGNTWRRIAWPGLGEARNADYPLETQRWLLLAILSQRLALLPGAVALSFRWADRGAGPLTLEVVSGWGFARAAWLQTAQLVSGVRSLYVCDGCGQPYARERKAKSGQHQFCPRCREGKKAAKRLWWAKHRGAGITLRPNPRR